MQEMAFQGLLTQIKRTRVLLICAIDFKIFQGHAPGPHARLCRSPIYKLQGRN